MEQKNRKTIFKEAIQLPQNTQLDKSLILGNISFGIGWGIADICPALALTLVELGHYQGLYFIISMILGIYIHKRLFHKI